MINLIDLEARWMRYKIKSYLPYFILISLMIVVFLLFFLYFTRDKELQLENLQASTQSTPLKAEDTHEHTPEIFNKESQEEETITKESAPIMQEELYALTPQVQKPQEPIVEERTQEKTSPPSRVFAPSMGFMKGIKNDSAQHYENRTFTQRKSTPQIEETYIEESIDVDFDDEELYTKQNIPSGAEERQSNKINIKRQNIEEDISGIIVRFKKSNNPALSLFIAKKYYELGDYHNAYNYALITNDLNRNIETSWLIFSKSLVKLGKKDMAIKTLKEYLGNSKSQSAKILLDEIESGKFK